MPPTHTDEGIVAAVEARRRQPGLAVLVLSAYVEQTFATELLAGGRARLGYLLKERVGRVEEFLEALHRVADGGTAIDPEVVAQLFARPAGHPAGPAQPARAGGARADGRGPGQHGDRRAALRHRRAPSTSTSAASSPSSTSPDGRDDRRVAAVLRYLDDAR